MFYSLEIDQIFPYFFVFVRLGAMLMLMPGFGEIYVPPRTRLLFGFVLTLVITPIVAIEIPDGELLSAETLLVLLKETFIGLFIGTIARIFLNALQTTATIMGLHTSLSSAVMFNPSMGTQDSIISSFLIMGATAMIFVTNTHYIILHALVNSYEVFPILGELPYEEMTHHVVGTVAKSFALGVQLSFPVMIVATVLNVASGLLNRLMPQMQVYFMVMPLQILAGFMLIAFTVSLILSTFISAFADFMGTFRF